MDDANRKETRLDKLQNDFPNIPFSDLIRVYFEEITNISISSSEPIFINCVRCLKEVDLLYKNLTQT